MFAGSSLDLSEVNNLFEAIIYAWFPGACAAESLKDIISGVTNPSGKLSMSLPKSVGQCPIYYNNYPTGRPYEGAEESYVTKYIDNSHYPLYSFGHGLSYSEVVIDDIEMVSEKSINEDLEIEVTVSNKSKVSAKEVVQIYINDLVASVIRPRKELKGFIKFEIGAGETKKVKVVIDKNEFGYIGNDLEHQIDRGEFDIHIGFNSIETKVKNY